MRDAFFVDEPHPGASLERVELHDAPVGVDGTENRADPGGADWTEARESARLVSSGHEDMHAGEIETSILLHAHPELVRDGYEAADWIADDRHHLLTTGMAEYTQSGVIGRPSLGSAEKGKAVLASLVASFAPVLDILQRDR